MAFLWGVLRGWQVLWRVDFQLVVGADLLQQAADILHRQRHTAFGWQIAGAGDVQENGAAQTGAGRIIVVPQHQHQIIQMIIAPQPFVAAGMGQRDQLVIGRVGRIIAPAHGRGDGGDGQAGLRSRLVIGAVKDLPQRVAPDGGGTIAFTLVSSGLQAPFSHSAAEGSATMTDLPLPGIGAGGDYQNVVRLIRHSAGRPYSTVLIGVGALVATVALPVVLPVRALVF